MEASILEYRKKQHQRYLESKRDTTINKSIKIIANDVENNTKPQLFSKKEIAGTKIVNFVRKCDRYTKYFINISTIDKDKIPGIFFIRLLIDGNLYGYDLRQFFFVAKDFLEKNEYGFFTHEQLTHVIVQWTKVDPSTRLGLRFNQNIEYSRCLAKDMCNQFAK